MRSTAIIFGLVAISSVLIGAFPPDQPLIPPDTTDETRIFRIQDYVPGEFESRLRWFELDLAGQGLKSTMDRPITTTRRDAFFLDDYSLARNYASLRADVNDWDRVYDSGRGMFQQDRHMESLRAVTDALLGFNLNHYGERNNYHGGESNIDPHGDESIRDGYSRRSSTGGTAIWDWDHRRYSRDRHFIRINPNVRLGKTWFRLDDDITRIRNDYSVDDLHLIRSFREIQTIRDEIPVTETSADFSLGVGVGHGRVYDGTTTWRACDLIEKVVELSGLSPDQVSHGEYEQLATLLYDLQQRKYPRQDQARLNDYEETEQVVAALERILDLEKMPANTVAEVHDILRHYPLFKRRFGSRLGMSIRGRYSVYHNKGGLDFFHRYEEISYPTGDTSFSVHWSDMDDEWENVREEFVPTLDLSYAVFQPLDHHWQLDWGGTFWVGGRWEGHRKWVTASTSIYDSDDDTTLVYDTASGDTTGLWQQRLEGGLHGELELTFIRDSRTWWQLSTYTAVQWMRLYPRPNSQDGYPAGHQEETALMAVWDGDLSYHRSLAWRLYLTVAVSYSLSYSDLAYELTDWADRSGGAGDLRVTANLAYYF